MSTGILNHNHLETHKKKFWTVSKRFLQVADDGTAIFRIKTNVKIPHIGWAIQAGGDAWIDAYKNPVFSNGGTSQSCHNNRLSGLDSDTTVFHTPTISDNGDLLFESMIIGGLRNQATGGESKGDQEWVLDLPNTEHMVVVTNKAGSAKDITIILGFYEESN